jgi:hypothetical protein
MVKTAWQDVARLAQELRDKSIDQVQPAIPAVPSQSELPLNTTSLPAKLLDDAEVKITETPPETLLKSLASGELTSLEVTTAFLRRAGIAQKLVSRHWLGNGHRRLY